MNYINWLYTIYSYKEVIGFTLFTFLLMPLQIVDANGKPFDTNLSSWDQINFWKTKEVTRQSDWTVALTHKGVITAFDNPEFTGISDEKWIASAYSSALLFKRLEEGWVKTSHRGILNANTTIEMPLDMMPFEIIWRRFNVKWNSWTGRNLGNSYAEWDRFDDIIYEACLKWSVEDIDATDEKNKLVHDPFLVLGRNFKPLLRADGMPRLTHSKTGKELNYSVVTHPNKWGVIPHDEVRAAIEWFSNKRTEIREMVEKVQRITYVTYAEIWRLNADGKIETDGTTLWDELELDSLRNMNPQHIRINWVEYHFDGDPLWTSLYKILWDNVESVSRIVIAHHSGKQHYRDQVAQQKNTPFDDARRAFNDAAAVKTTQDIYLPVAMALSDRFGKEVWYQLIH